MKCYDLNYLRENKKFFLNKIDFNENNCGMFFFKIYDLKKISNLDIRTNNINRKSKFGSGLVINLKLIKFFFDSII